MKTKLLFTKQISNTFYLLLVLCFCFNYGWSQTNLTLNSACQEYTITADMVTANPTWTRNDGDNADAWDCSPNTSVITDADAVSGGATSASPYNAIWDNDDLDAWLNTFFSDSSEQPGSSSDGNKFGPKAGVGRGLKLNEASRRIYQKVVGLTPGTSYTLFMDSRSEAMNVPSEVYMLNTEIVTEEGINANGAADASVDAYMEITNDFNSSNSSSTNDTFTTNSLEFTASGSFVVIYVRALDAVSSSFDVFYDNIELYETSELSVDDVFASNVKIYPNPTNGVVNIQSNNAKITSISVYDLLGKQVFVTDKLIDNQINLSGLNHGVYVLDVKSGNRSAIKKIIIE